MKISEVYIDPSGPGSFVELQFTGPVTWGSWTLNAHQNPTTPDSQCSVSLTAPAHLDSQRTYLIAGVAVPGRDATCPFNFSAAAGHVCLDNASGVIDSVGWGTFPPLGGGIGCKAPPPANNVAPAGIPSGQSISRTLDRGCATLLEAEDDTDDSAADFALGSPTPRPNATSPTEQPCKSESPVCPTEPPCERVEPTNPGKGEAPGAIKVVGGKAFVELACKGGPCEGTVKLIAKFKVRKGKQRITKRVQIGKAQFKLAANTTKTVQVQLSKAGQRLLEKRGRLKVRLTGNGVKHRSTTLKKPATGAGK